MIRRILAGLGSVLLLILGVSVLAISETYSYLAAVIVCLKVFGVVAILCAWFVMLVFLVWCVIHGWEDVG